MKMIYKSKEANLKYAESLVSTGDKFYWLPHIMIFGYFFNLKNISEIESSIYIIIIVFVISISIGLFLRIKGLKVYDYIYRQNIKKNKYPRTFK